MGSLLNNIISKIKGESYTLDERLTKSDLLSIFSSRFWMLVRGKLSFANSGGRLFIGKGVELKHRRLIRFGKGVTIADHSYLDALSSDGIVLGDNVSIGKSTSIECSGSFKTLGKGIVVGRNVGLGRDCFYGCAGGIKIGDDTIVGNFVSFHSENHNYEDTTIPIRLQGVNHQGIVVGKDCWIGAKATILDGVVIGDGCIIAASALVVAGKYESGGIYGGVPAKLLKMRYSTNE